MGAFSNFTIKQISKNPIRYSLARGETELFTIGKKTYQVFFEQKEDSSLISSKSKPYLHQFPQQPQQSHSLVNSPFINIKNDVKSIAQKELDNLYEEATQHLAKRDISPKQLIAWFDKREVHPKLKTKLINKLKKNKFFDEKRFLEKFVSHRYLMGNKPWWITKKELAEHGYSADEMTPHAYSNSAALIDFYNKRMKKEAKKEDLEKLQEKLSKKLIRQGFSFSEIKKLFEAMKNNVES